MVLWHGGGGGLRSHDHSIFSRGHFRYATPPPFFYTTELKACIVDWRATPGGFECHATQYCRLGGARALSSMSRPVPIRVLLLFRYNKKTTLGAG